MSQHALFARHAEMLRDPSRYGIEGTYMDPSTSPATAVPVTGIFEILGVDPLLQLQEGTQVMEQGTFEVPSSMAIDVSGSFVIEGDTWKITGLGGRDANLKTITIQRPIIVSKRMAKRRG